MTPDLHGRPIKVTIDDHHGEPLVIMLAGNRPHIVICSESAETTITGAACLPIVQAVTNLIFAALYGRSDKI